MALAKIHKCESITCIDIGMEGVAMAQVKSGKDEGYCYMCGIYKVCLLGNDPGQKW